MSLMRTSLKLLWPLRPSNWYPRGFLLSPSKYMGSTVWTCQTDLVNTHLPICTCQSASWNCQSASWQRWDVCDIPIGILWGSILSPTNAQGLRNVNLPILSIWTRQSASWNCHSTSRNRMHRYSQVFNSMITEGKSFVRNALFRTSYMQGRTHSGPGRPSPSLER